ncbi:MAG TPA: tetratricopeptide repeat protein, partial [Longimicrobiaceae bacterium]|nr:tetratricopeptide repeat protein [Longimicrobiaceae bacterium]
VYLLLGRGDDAPPGERIALPPPAPPVDAAAVQWEDFVGAEACAQCHAPQYEAWRRSTHGQAGGPPSRERILGSFDGTPIYFRDAIVIPSVNARGEFIFTVRQEGMPEEVVRVDGVVGGGHMVGGGTQGFVSRAADGTLRFLPFDFHRQNGVWFCNTNTRSDKGWVAISREVALADCGDWPPVRVFGEVERYANCQSCHGSQIQVAFDTAQKRYDTRVQSLAINCESCHGPGRQHVDLARSGRIRQSADIGIRALGTLSKDASLEVCFQCHAVKDVVEPGYLAGKSLQEHYSLLLPLLGERPLHPDGRVRTFAYQENHLFSDCYLNGSLTCTDCHDPHSQGYRDNFGRPLSSRFDDGQCLGCHASKAEPLQAHTFHEPQSAGSRCVACHMPYLQHPEVGRSIQYARSDHTINIPRPGFDSELGIVSACQQCHTDQAPAALERQVERWYGEIKPHNPTTAALLRARQVTNRKAAAELLLQGGQRHTAGQFAGVAYLLENHFTPDMPRLEPEIAEALQLLARSDDPDLKAIALAALHVIRGEDARVRAFLAEGLRNLGPQDAVVRRRWAVILGFLADSYRERRMPREAITVYRKALEIRSDDPNILRNLGIAHADAGDPAGAVAHYRRALAIEPDQPLTLVQLGIALNAQGDLAGAVSSYQRAIALYPHDPIPHFNLGNIYLRQQQPAEAAEHYREAARLNPGLAQAHFNLARAYIFLGEYPRALTAVRRGLTFAPSDPTAQQMLRDLEQTLAGP